MNLEQARFNMVEQQIRSSGRLDDDIRELLHLVRREDFVPAGMPHLAFADVALPLGHGQCMLTPRNEAAALQALKPRKHDSVLLIGTGSGHVAALLAVHASHVTTFEIDPEIAEFARANLHRAGIGNVTVVVGDGFSLAPQEQFDVILLSGGLAEMPADLPARLRVNGRLLAFVGKPPVQTACLVTRIDDAGFQLRQLFETSVTPLRNAPGMTGLVL